MTEPKKYRKKPVVVEAMQYTGENRKSLVEWCGVRGAKSYICGNNPKRRHLCMETPSGDVILAVGDWVIQDTAGHFFQCKSYIFEATYEPE